MTDVPPEITLRRLAIEYCASRALHVVAELGVADHLGDQTCSASELGQACGADPDSLNRLLRLLVTYGIFQVRDDGYAHSEASRLLRSDDPRSMRSLVRMLGSATWHSFGALEYSARTGKTAIGKVFGESLFSYLAKHPEESRLFNEAMTAKSRGDIGAILDAYDFSAFGSVADIGGGRGHLIRAIVERFPSVNGILFDLPHIIAESTSIISSGIQLKGGDFFKEDLPAADAYTLWNIIHDWPDSESLAILSAIRKVAPPNARLLVLEQLIPEGSEPHPVKALDLHMLAVTGGRERTRAEYEKLFSRSGFRLDRVIQTGSPIAVVEGIPV